MKCSVILAACLVVTFAGGLSFADDPSEFDALGRTYAREIRPLVERYCFKCHSGDLIEAEIDLASFASLADVRKQAEVWQKVGEMLDGSQMPPKDAPQPADAERTTLRNWVRTYLTHEAKARAGDPGRVVLRRLNNAEYTYTLRDLTGELSLSPAREFPVDGAAGEGFTNTGNALVMSPALVVKQLDAAKEVAAHAVLLPDGFRFSPHVTRRDWTNETLGQIRQFYRDHSASGTELAPEAKGLSDGGLIPLERYLSALLGERSGNPIPAGLSPKYLRILRETLDGTQPSPILDPFRARWRAAQPGDAAELAREMGVWQRVLWTFNPVGHIGKIRGPKIWMQPVSPLQGQSEARVKLPSVPADDVVLYLTATDAGDGAEHDFVVWQKPRFVAPGRPDILLKDVRALTRELLKTRARVFADADKYLLAAGRVAESGETVKVDDLAREHGLDAGALRAWLDCLGISGGGPVKIEGHFTEKLADATYAFVRGWGTGATPLVMANSSGEHVRIPGNLKPHGVAVHPSPALDVIVGWQSPIAGRVKIAAKVLHAHPECGNGVTWSLEHRRGSNRHRLASGIAHGGTPPPIDPLPNIDVQPGDLVSVTIGPRDANHSCDLTAVDLTISTGDKTWDLAADVSEDVQAGNPHADRQGNAAVWHFCTQPVAARGDAGFVIPKDSALDRWRLAKAPEDKTRLAGEVKRLLTSPPPAKDSPDAAWVGSLSSFRGPILSRLHPTQFTADASPEKSSWGVDPALFGKHPGSASAVDADSMCVQAPSAVEVRVPADLVAGYEFVASPTIHSDAREQGCVQAQVLTAKPELRPGLIVPPPDASLAPLIAAEGSAVRARFEAAFDEVRAVFPATLCYTKIVPIDEVVTLTLYYREDEPLGRLMLDDSQQAHLDRLWSELHYISHDASAIVEALEQIIQYATQDSDPTAFIPLREPFAARAAEFQTWRRETEPAHLARLLEFADRAYRRKLSQPEAAELRGLYDRLRLQEVPHEDAFRLTLARVLISPAFLYRIEKPGAGATQQPVTNDELATRLSYFLWSSLPDDELRAAAAGGQLTQPETLLAQTRRMLGDPKASRLATEFAAQWLHIHGFEDHDEKSERHFPTFAALRGAMAEESARFFTDLFQSNGSVLDVIDADYTFLNEDLAKHYGIPDVTGPEWRRVDGVRKFSRGGILTQATTLSVQSGASRTSPILRGNWLSEVVLGEKLPKPPKNVPVLAETVPDGLTERQLIEQHTRDQACAKCHARIDPLGFALENFDAIGRYREQDAAGLKVDTQTQLQDGTKLAGLDGLRTWLLTARRDAFTRQFCKKLLGYALGRAVQLSDEPLLAEMQSALAAKGFKSHVAVETIVMSRQFREIRGRQAAENE